jgi:hypothetical protein
MEKLPDIHVNNSAMTTAKAPIQQANAEVHVQSLRSKSQNARLGPCIIIVILACMSTILLYSGSLTALACLFLSPAPETYGLKHPLTKYATTAVAPFLEVFQVYPPVLTAEPDGALEITDGSTDTSPATIRSRSASCQEILTVYSFAYSYGQPFIGEYSSRPTSNARQC